MFGEKDEVEFWNTLLRMLLENPGGDVGQSSARHTCGMNNNSAPWVVTASQKWGKQGDEVKERKMNQITRFQGSNQKFDILCVGEVIYSPVRVTGHL